MSGNAYEPPPEPPSDPWGQTDSPPRWFSPFAARYMTDRDWIGYFRGVSIYLMSHSTTYQCFVWNQWLERVVNGQAGGPNDGGGR